MKKFLVYFSAVLLLIFAVQALSTASTYEYLTQWGSPGGSPGGGPGQFANPLGGSIAVGPSGTVYVADTFNHRVQKFTSDGTSLGILTGYATNPAAGFTDTYIPIGVAVDSTGNIYVAVAGSNHIQKFNPAGTWIAQWGVRGSGDGEFGPDGPRGVAVDSSGNVYVADFGNNRVQKFTSSGGFITKWGSAGEGDGQFQHLYGIAVDSSGNVYVADQFGNRIEKFTSSGTFITKWGDHVSVPGGRFANPQGIAVNSAGDVFVAGWGTHNIDKYTSTGTLLTTWGSEGSGNGQFQLPAGVAVSSGEVYVLEFLGNRVQKFTLPPVANAGPDSVTTGTSVTLNASGSSDFDGGTIVSYSWVKDIDGDGAYETALGSGQVLTVAVPFGVHRIQLTVTDNSGVSDTDTALVANADIGSLAAQIAGLQAELDSIASNVGLLPPSSAAAINAEIDSIQADLLAANNLLSDIKTLLGVGSTDEIISAIEALQGALDSAENEIAVLEGDLAVLKVALTDIARLIGTPQGRRVDPGTNYTTVSDSNVLGAFANDIIDMLLAPPGQNIRNQEWK